VDFDGVARLASNYYLISVTEFKTLPSSFQQNQFTWEIKSESSWFQWRLHEIWKYRHLLLRIVRRDFLIHHQQTLLGPLWIVFQPILVLGIYILIFGKAVGLSTDGINPTLFYLSGIILWSLFSETFSGTAFTFVQNAQLFSKVYFPRLLIPLSIGVLNYFRFLIQFALFFVLLIVIDPVHFTVLPFRTFSIFVLTTVIVTGLGVGCGLVFSVFTAKYRDLVNMIHMLIRLMMFATPVIYPLSMVDEKFRRLLILNPLSSLFELFRYGFLGAGTFEIMHLLYSIACMCAVLLFGSMLFNKFGNKLQDVL